MTQSWKRSGRKLSPRGGLKLSSLLLNIAHPVGSIIQTTKTQAQFNPNTMLGGTWRLLQGVFLFGADADSAITGNVKDGGSTDAVIVSHRHPLAGQSAAANSAGAHVHFCGWERQWYAKGNYWANYQSTPGSAFNTGSAGAHSHSLSGYSDYEGVSASGKNMPPYKNVNIWERTA